MNILWCGGEDIDFPTLIGTGTVNTTIAAGYRSGGWARAGSILSTSGPFQARSAPFPAGALTSAWVTFRILPQGAGVTNSLLIGVGSSSAAHALGIGIETASATKTILVAFNGVTNASTTLATESSSPGSLPSGASSPYRVDMQITNFGASCTVNIYVNFILILTFTGDVTQSGTMTSFDSVWLFAANTNNKPYFSEIIVTDDDTRSLPGLVTLALTGAGTTDSWTGAYSTINQTTFSDASPNYTNVVAQDQQFNVTDVPAGVYTVKAVKIAARAAHSTGSTATQIQLGYKNGASTNFHLAAQTVGTAYGTFESLDQVDPTTSNPWALADMNALQLDVRSS